MKIFHFTSKAAFQTTSKEGYYRPESLTLEGFIHCSMIEQVLDAAEALCKRTRGLDFIMDRASSSYCAHSL